MSWVVARTAKRRPTLMHLIADRTRFEGPVTVTACGVQMVGWSRAYFQAPIPQIACMKCQGINQKGGVQ